MSGDRPRVSVGLPVFNGERYLEETLDSILAQTYSDFELIISDNASTDRTEEICRAYAAKDERIRYFRNGTNLGAAKNFNRVFELSSGEYFKWAPHDDIIAPDFLMRCVEVLDQDPTVVLCYSKVKFIDEFGSFLTNYDIELKNVGSFKPQDRFGDLVLMDHWCIDVLGVIRASALKMTPVIASFVGSDRHLLVELGLLGRFYQIPEYLLFSRRHSEQSIRAVPLYSRAAWFDSANKDWIVSPYWRFFFECFKSVRYRLLSRHEQACCYIHMLNFLRSHKGRLAKELFIVACQILHHFFTPRTKDQEMLQKAS